MSATGHDAAHGVEDMDATLKLLIERGAQRDLTDGSAAEPPPTSHAGSDQRGSKVLER